MTLEHPVTVNGRRIGSARFTAMAETIEVTLDPGVTLPGIPGLSIGDTHSSSAPRDPGLRLDWLAVYWPWSRLSALVEDLQEEARRRLGTPVGVELPDLTLAELAQHVASQEDGR